MENKLKHLEFLQNVITRMNTNSFMIKGWVVTLVSALFVLSAVNSNPFFTYITYFIIPTFWALDGIFLSTERQYRDLYNEIRILSEDKIDFSMDATKYKKGKSTWFYSTFSKTLNIFYIPTLFITIMVIIILVIGKT